jgi:hypothetical protein
MMCIPAASEMALFETLRTIRDFERRELPFIRTIEDVDLVREIGFHQEAGQPLTLTELFALGLASPATVQRRLAQLKALGVVQQSRLDRDRRSFALVLSPEVLKAYEKYLALLKRLGSRHNARAPKR